MAHVPNRHVRGFSLVEIVIALFIISVAVVFVMMVMGTIKVTRDSTFENIAFRIADNKINELRAGGYAALPPSGSFSDPLLATIPQGAASTTITVWNAKTKRVATGVSWLGTDNVTRSVLFATLITESGGL